MQMMTTYEPWATLRRMQEEMNRQLAELRGEADESRVVTSRWSPAVDIKEEPERFVLTADVPGVPAADIEVTMEKGVLTIKGERKAEHEDKREGYRRIERIHGLFHRRFALPETADSDNISARTQDGVLEVVIPKKPAAQPRRIEVVH